MVEGREAKNLNVLKKNWEAGDFSFTLYHLWKVLHEETREPFYLEFGSLAATMIESID